MLLEVPLKRQDTDLHGRIAWASSSALPAANGETLLLGDRLEGDAAHRAPGSLRDLCDLLRVVVEACGSHDRFRHPSGLLASKMPEPTKTPSAPSCITSAASAGVLMPPATKFTTGSQHADATSLTSSNGAWSLGATNSSSSRIDSSLRISERTSRSWRTASTMLPVPASPFVRIIAAPSLMRRSASPRFRQPHTNGTLNACLSMWLVSSAGEHLGLVDVVHAEGFEHLGLDEVPDPGLGHDRDRDRVHDPSMMAGSLMRATPPAARMSAGTRSSAMTATAPASSAIFAIGRDDVHDDAALEHLGEPLRGPGWRFRLSWWNGFLCCARFAGRVWPRGPRPFESAEPLARSDYRTDPKIPVRRPFGGSWHAQRSIQRLCGAPRHSMERSPFHPEPSAQWNAGRSF